MRSKIVNPRRFNRKTVSPNMDPSSVNPSTTVKKNTVNQPTMNIPKMNSMFPSAGQVSFQGSVTPTVAAQLVARQTMKKKNKWMDRNWLGKGTSKRSEGSMDLRKRTLISSKQINQPRQGF
uniref:Uncharacterized protein n=1 Tax=Polytomella parva TaxID=51329 RepID=A0A7S0UY35_9CHLO|mmetsp:Transcript_20490/g.36754  ORF Transcript_20490/g.36754 Transcript_20490/m.36754 type:complete len:121 (+) Transcript_20490:393-755(+)